jgi:hypothetical protein
MSTLRFLLPFLCALLASGSSLQLNLDAFKLAPSLSTWSLMIKTLHPSASSTNKTLRMVNIKSTNLRLADGTPLGTSIDGIVLEQLPGGLFSSGMLSFIKVDDGLPTMLSFDLEFAETGERFTTDEFGLFLFDLIPSFSAFSSESSNSSTNDPLFLDPPPGNNPPPPGSGNPPPGTSNPPSGDNTQPPGDNTQPPGDNTQPPGDNTLPPGSGNPPTNTIDPLDPAAIPEPSTFLLLLVPLALIYLKRS